MKPIIRVNHISKQYSLNGQAAAPQTLRESLMQTAGLPLRMLRRSKNGAAAKNVVTTAKNSFWALDDVSFEVEPGAVVGIIGRNGAGKSTLLKILSRITEPTRGKIELYGRIGSLLEVGTGFHPELSGRENVFLNGAILGMKREEIAKKFDEIVAFAEIEKFVDTPVKHYSSGMYVRLAFAVAAHLEPEILIVDEVLAVGDSEFQKKCLGKMDEVSNAGRTVLFVSHQMGMLAQLCKTCLLLEKGALVLEGKTDQVINAYLNRRGTNGSSYVFDPNKVQDKTAFIVYQKMVGENGHEVSEITNENPIILETKIRVESLQNDLELSVSLQNKLKGRIFTVNVPLDTVMSAGEKEKIVRLEVPANLIVPNHYSWLSAIHVPGYQMLDVLWDECDFSIKDVGTEFARYEGMDYGCILLDQYKIRAFND